MGVRKVRATVFAISLAASGSACVFEPEGAEPIAAGAEHREWWARTQSCSGLSGSFERLRWFVVPGRDFACPTGRCIGRWEPGHRIYIAEAWVESEFVTRHEMLHDLLGKPGHPDPPFGNGCPLTWESWPGPMPGLAAAAAID
jgi:hypothetical protein